MLVEGQPQTPFVSLTQTPSSASTSSGLKSVAWTKLDNVSLAEQAVIPKARHGHRAVACGNFMIIYGGGNNGIIDQLHVFDTVHRQWMQPTLKGDIPPASASSGFVGDERRLLLFGGMLEFGIQTNSLFELSLKNWEWRRLNPTPLRGNRLPDPRIGHTFTMVKDKAYLFGGLTSSDEGASLGMGMMSLPRYINDFYVLDARYGSGNGSWEEPITYGNPPSPRESHTTVAYQSEDGRHNKLIVYGGMNGTRLGDLHFLDLDTMMWCKPQLKGILPAPRSLHTASVVGDKMYVFGGWIPTGGGNDPLYENEWRCTNSLACFDIKKLAWQTLHDDAPHKDDVERKEVKLPPRRAGHSAAVVNRRVYIWSGRDGYRTARNSQRCCSDLWRLDVEKPGMPGKVQLMQAGPARLEVRWNPVPGADSYILQCCPFVEPLSRSSK